MRVRQAEAGQEAPWPGQAVSGHAQWRRGLSGEADRIHWVLKVTWKERTLQTAPHPPVSEAENLSDLSRERGFPWAGISRSWSPGLSFLWRSDGYGIRAALLL